MTSTTELKRNDIISSKTYSWLLLIYIHYSVYCQAKQSFFFIWGFPNREIKKTVDYQQLGKHATRNTCCAYKRMCNIDNVIQTTKLSDLDNLPREMSILSWLMIQRGKHTVFPHTTIVWKNKNLQYTNTYLQ